MTSSPGPIPNQRSTSSHALVHAFSAITFGTEQYAAMAAFTPASIAELDAHVRRYRTNRRLLMDGLPQLGITKLAPADGAFYIYAQIGHLTDDSLTWCADVLDRTGVALAPGIDFDTEQGSRTVRLSFAGATAEIEMALDRLREL